MMATAEPCTPPSQDKPVTKSAQTKRCSLGGQKARRSSIGSLELNMKSSHLPVSTFPFPFQLADNLLSQGKKAAS